MDAVLIHGADAAYPEATSTLPADVKVVLGYVGLDGYTPHVWTAAQVAAVRASGRTWLPIVVPPQGKLTDAVADQCVTVMDARAKALGCKQTQAVFIDIEYSAYHANPTVARAFVARWQAGMLKLGWTKPYGYGPTGVGAGWWIAAWTSKTQAGGPTALPAGVVGIQYSGAEYWDWDLFDAVALGLVTPPAPAQVPTPNGAVVSLQQLLGIKTTGTWTPVTQAVTASHLVHIGDAGSLVRWVQARVHVVVDGAFGPETRVAVVAWQRAHRLTADGVVGPITYRALCGL